MRRTVESQKKQPQTYTRKRCGEGSAGRQFRIRVTDENDDSYLSCSPPIEVASEEEDEEEEELSPCVIENVPLSSDDETGRNDDGTDCEWVGTTSSDDDEGKVSH